MEEKEALEALKALKRPFSKNNKIMKYSLGPLFPPDSSLLEIGGVHYSKTEASGGKRGPNNYFDYFNFY